MVGSASAAPVGASCGSSAAAVVVLKAAAAVAGFGEAAGSAS